MDQKLGYLKDSLLTNVPKLVTMAKRVGQYPETDYNTKQPTGRMQTLYTFHLPDGPDVRHYAKEREEETLSLFKPGETLQVVRQESVKDDGKRISFLVWTPPEGAEARMAAAPQMGNTRMAGDAKKLEERQNAESEKWAKKDIAVTLGMLVKMFFEDGKDFDSALANAKKCRPKFVKAINDCYTEDVLGINQEPKFADELPASIKHTPSVQVSDLPF